jgi:outer membrane protein OmpA-like peptidoglycan-associated protein
MSKYLSLICLVFFSVKSFAQLGFNTSSVSLSLGNHFAVENQGSATRIFRPSHINVNYRYMFNNKFGLMSTFGYDRFTFKNNFTPSNYFRLSIETSVNLREILGFSEFVENFGTLAHTGVGLSGLWSKNIANSDIFKKTNFDQLLHFTFGLTPKYRINNQFSVHVDLSYITQLNQDFFYDTRTIIKPKEGISGGFVNFSAGVTMSIGPRKHHADWYTFPTLIDKDLEKINLLEIQLEQLEMKLEDFDGDGVSNYQDDEPNTPKGNQVDARGVTIGKLNSPDKPNELDSLFQNNQPNNPNTNTQNKEKTVYVDTNNLDSDGDGVPDIYDLLPNVVGTYKGCPDADGDKIPDIIDDCPNLKGIEKFNGCPEKKVEPVQIPEPAPAPKTEIKPEPVKPADGTLNVEIKPENAAFSEVFFEVGVSMLSIKSTSELDKVAKYLKENPKVNVDVIGFADQSGSPIANDKLSKQRANECVNYLVSKGINKNRFTISNITVVNKEGINPLLFGAKNRKVSFILKP